MRVKQWISLFLCVIILLPGCAASEEKKTEREIFAMDTIMNLTFYGENGEQAMTAAVSEIQQLEKTLSVTKADSEISKINAAGGKKVTVSKETYDLLSACIQYGNDTDGLFDISIYPLVKLWGFTTEKYHVPDKAERDAVIKKIDYKKIELLSDYQVRIPSGMAIDLGAAAKGYLSQKIIDLCKEKKVISCILSLGGNVQTLNTRPDGKPWQIGIQNPNGQQGSLLAVLSVENKAVITSGGYERYFEEDGNTYIHILNPKTGYPADSGLVSVSVISENGMLADALSTSLYLMGEEQAAGYWRTHADEFDMILETEDGTLYVTEGISQEIQTDNTTIVLNTEE